MTPRQQEFLVFIKKYHANHGYAPTVREIGKAMGVLGMGTVVDTLRRLEEGGQINRKAGKARGIEIAANPWEQIGKAALRVLDSIKSENIDDETGEGTVTVDAAAFGDLDAAIAEAMETHHG